MWFLGKHKLITKQESYEIKQILLEMGEEILKLRTRVNSLQGLINRQRYGEKDKVEDYGLTPEQKENVPDGDLRASALGRYA